MGMGMDMDMGRAIRVLFGLVGGSRGPSIVEELTVQEYGN